MKRLVAHQNLKDYSNLNYFLLVSSEVMEYHKVFSVDFLQPELEMPDSNSAEKQLLHVDPLSGIPGLSEPSAHVELEQSVDPCEMQHLD